MKKFVAVFIGSEHSANAKKWDALDEKTRGERERAGMAAWGNWIHTHAKSIVDTGCPLGATKQVGPGGVTAAKNQLTAYTVVQAESHDAAAKMFVDHPHFAIFPGDSIEVMECLPIPGPEDL